MTDDRSHETRRRPDHFQFTYDPPTIRYGTGAVADLDAVLADSGFDRGVVVCGSTVGSTAAVVDPVTDGLGDRLAGVFDETTPEKRLSTAFDVLERARERDADVLVALGGGSSLDVATVASALSTLEREERGKSADESGSRRIADAGREFLDRGTFELGDGDALPVVAVPTTLAGAELSQVAGITADPGGRLFEPSGAVANEPSTGDGTDDLVGGGVSDPRLLPAAVVADPALVATTPHSVLAASAMNGFDKGIETLYARNATPFTDGTAVRGLQLLADGLVALGAAISDGADDLDPAVLEPVVQGILCVQYGVSRPDGSTLSIVHAFGHGLTRTYDVQQGAAHAIAAPHVLEYVFDRVDGRRALLAAGLGVGDADDHAEAVLERVTEIRDALGLPSRLRDVDGPEPGEFSAVAEEILDDSFLANAPPGLEPTAEEFADVLRAAY